MSDSYSAIYDAVRSRISNGDIGAAVADVISNSGISHAAEMAKYAIQEAAGGFMRPSVMFRPTLSVDGNQYCALYGENLHEGCAGFGDTADLAMWDFDKNWREQKAPRAAIALAGEAP
jgi:hypothetical protein